MNHPPRVSVVTIFWNAEKFLSEAIESVLEQTFDSWELILVDDGSTDGSPRIADEYARTNPGRIFHVEHEGHSNCGMSASRNLGVERARGEYVAFLDADDAWMPGKLARQVEILDLHGDVSLTYGPVEFWFGWTGVAEDVARDSIVATGFPPDSILHPPELLLGFLRGDVPVPVLSSTAARRRLFSEVGRFEAAFRGMYEDQVFLTKVCLSRQVFAEAHCQTRYRQHPDSYCEISLRTGEYAFDRPHPAGERFLGWLRDYLAAMCFEESEAAALVRRRLLPYKYPRLDRFRRVSTRLLERIEAQGAELWRSAGHLGRRAMGGPTGSIIATPNPIRVRDRSRVGATTLSWSSERTSAVEVRVGAPDGALFSRSGPSGSASTGRWVQDGMTFYLTDASEERPLSSRRTLATVTLRVDEMWSSHQVVLPPGLGTVRFPLASEGAAQAKTLVVGWFSFSGMGATAGDLLACELVCDWLVRAGRPYDVALAAPFSGGVNWLTVDPQAYSDVAFVCGPFWKSSHLPDLVRRFPRARLVGVNVSLLEDPGDLWRPFDVLFERDGPARSRPDITFLSRTRKVPVVGLVRVQHEQPEYGERGMHAHVDAAIGRLLDSREVAVVSIDTRLDTNSTGLRSCAEIESLISRMDVIVTTRLHGMVFALKNGVPALAVDPIRGGAKIMRQGEAIGWPVVFVADSVTDQDLARAFEYCLTGEARTRAGECAEAAAKMVKKVGDLLVAAMTIPDAEPEA